MAIYTQKGKKFIIKIQGKTKIIPANAHSFPYSHIKNIHNNNPAPIIAYINTRAHPNIEFKNFIKL